MSGTRQSQSQDQLRKNAQIEIYKSIAERKEVGIAALKGWDQNSRQNLQDMRGLIDYMYEKLTVLMEDSYARQEKLIKFFSSIKIQTSSEFSLKEHLPKFTLGPTKVDPKTKARVPLDSAQAALGGYLDSVERELHQFQTNLNSFQKQIETFIVGKILIERTKEQEAKLKELLGQKKEIKDRIKKLLASTKTSYDELFKQLYISLGESNRVRRPTVNVFGEVFLFVNNVRKLSMAVREYGIYFVEIFKAAKQLEKDRLSSGRDAFFEFNATMEKTFSATGLQGIKASELSLRKISPAVWNADYFQPSEILTSQQADTIRKKTGSPEITLETMRDYIAKEKIEENIKELFDHFIMRRFLVRESDARSAAQNDVIVYLTIDYYYSIYQFNKVSKKHALLVNVPIEQVTLNFKDSATVVFVFEEVGFLWNSKKKISLVFAGGEREELKTDHENFNGLLTIGQRIADMAPPQDPRPAQPPMPVTPSPPTFTEVSEIENRALAFSQAQIPDAKTLATEEGNQPPEPAHPEEPNTHAGFGDDAQMERWDTD